MCNISTAGIAVDECGRADGGHLKLYSDGFR
jgi:hypothetical protein